MADKGETSAKTAPAKRSRDGIWLAYYEDWSGCSAFSTEVDALRYAVTRGMQVKRVRFGQDLRDQVNAP